jgi:hypothetical protein
VAGLAGSAGRMRTGLHPLRPRRTALMATGWQPIQLVVGNAWGRSAPVAFPGDALYAVDMDAGATLEIPPGFAERGIYLASGSISLGGETWPAASWACCRTRPHRCDDRPRTQPPGLAGRPYAGRPPHSGLELRLHPAGAHPPGQGRLAARALSPVPGETEFIPLPTRG